MTTSAYQDVIIAGFGGQGVMLIGNLLAQAGMEYGREVSFLPVYGAEMRGGTANCTVVIDVEAVGSPLVQTPLSTIVLNEPSLAKFQPRLADGGVQIEAVGNPPAFLTENGGLQLTNRKPLDMPTSGGPGVPLAAALGTALMGVGAILAVTQLRAPKRGRGRKNGGKRS